MGPPLTGGITFLITHAIQEILYKAALYQIRAIPAIL